MFTLIATVLAVLAAVAGILFWIADSIVTDVRTTSRALRADNTPYLPVDPRSIR
jgi:hypothetical protein